ncbi:hypothetical protein FACS1894186_7690 [Alphaproteobacteria bacterium]|nr:hypothetical protein FACS1894186_7690 [Alphaproteobacteria bacterium]
MAVNMNAGFGGIQAPAGGMQKVGGAKPRPAPEVSARRPEAAETGKASEVLAAGKKYQLDAAPGTYVNLVV